MNGTQLAGLFVLGLIVGSFLNVVIHRVPQGASIVRPGSACPSCGHQLSIGDNIPVLSWAILRGRCRYCDVAISPRYPIVELSTALLFALTGWNLGLDWALPAFLYLVAAGVALALIDLDVQRLPDVITLPSYLVGGGLLLVPAIAYGEWGAYGRAWLGAAAMFAFYFLLVLIYPRGMGFGDVKLAGVLGLYLAWLGWGVLVTGGFLGFLLGAVVGGTLMALGRARRKSKIPFGPFMLVGALIAIYWGQDLWDRYLSVLS